MSLVALFLWLNPDWHTYLSVPLLAKKAPKGNRLHFIFIFKNITVRTSEARFFNNVNTILIDHCFILFTLHDPNSLFCLST